MNKLQLTIMCAALGFLGGKLTEAKALDLGISVGQSITKKAPNGVWWQDGMAYSMDLKSSAYRLYVNGKPFKYDWLHVELDYINYGNISGDLAFVSDENYSSNPSNPCRAPAEAPRTAIWKGKAYGMGLSLVPTLNTYYGSFGVRLGVMEYHAETNVTAQNFHNNFVHDDNPVTAHYNMVNNGFSYYYGLQYRYKALGIEYSHAPMVKAGDDGVQRGVKFIGVSLSKSF